MSENGDEPATKTDVQAVRADVQAVRADVQTVKADVQAVKADVQAVRSELAATEQRLDKAITGVAKDLVNLQADVHRIQESIPTQSDWQRLYNLLDETLGAAKDNRRTLLVFDKALGKNRETLDDHEGRIQALEAKP